MNRKNSRQLLIPLDGLPDGDFRAARDVALGRIEEAAGSAFVEAVKGNARGLGERASGQRGGHQLGPDEPAHQLPPLPRYAAKVALASADAAPRPQCVARQR